LRGSVLMKRCSSPESPIAPPGGIQAGCQRRVRYAAPIPNGLDEVVFADDALPVADQVIEQIENLRRCRHHIRAAPQLAPVGVERVVLEEIPQGTFPQLPFEAAIAKSEREKNKPPVRKM
jgi:hypothetical protein